VILRIGPIARSG